MYTLLSSLDEVAHFGGKTFTALGYATQPKRGLSFEALVAHQKEFVEFANNWAKWSVRPASRWRTRSSAKRLCMRGSSFFP
eukprot:4008338-Pleurochrysis_carterae.AAC.1